MPSTSQKHQRVPDKVDGSPSDEQLSSEKREFNDALKNLGDLLRKLRTELQTSTAKMAEKHKAREDALNKDGELKYDGVVKESSKAINANSASDAGKAKKVRELGDLLVECQKYKTSTDKTKLKAMTDRLNAQLTDKNA